MPGRDFFARMGPQFAQHLGSAQENADRQANVERLVAKAEYEFYQLRRELMGLVEGVKMLSMPAPAEADAVAEAPAPAKAA
jgi:hypothetical protein